MNTAELATAYEYLLEIAESVGPDTPLTSGRRADLDWRLSHIALSDGIIATAARRHLDGAPAVVDNQAAMDHDRIATMISTTSHRERAEAVRCNAAALCDVLGSFDARAARSDVRLRVHNRAGEHVSDARMPWSELVELRAGRHIPGHAAQIAALLQRG